MGIKFSRSLSWLSWLQFDRVILLPQADGAVIDRWNHEKSHLFQVAELQCSIRSSTATHGSASFGYGGGFFGDYTWRVGME
jgi:hypothetical protein